MLLGHSVSLTAAGVPESSLLNSNVKRAEYVGEASYKNLILAANTSLPPKSPPSPLFAREVPSSGQVPVGLKKVGPGKSLAGLEFL